MPCFDSQERPRTVSRDAVVFNSQEEYEKTVLYNSAATHLLCEAMTIIKNKNLLLKCSSNLIAWYNKHQKDDLERVGKILANIKEKQRELDEIYAAMDENDVEIMKTLIKEEEEEWKKSDYLFDNMKGSM
jgi:hypothetical protein